MKLQWVKAFFSALLLWSFLLNSIPVKAQGEIVTSEDISGGSSVFVFRRSSKAPQAKYAPKSKPNRSNAQKEKDRNALKAQSKTIASTRPKPTPKPKVTPTPSPTGGKKTPTPTPIKTIPAEEASNAIALGGETQLERGEIDKAIASFRQAIKLYSKNEFAKGGLSDALTQKANSYPESDADLAIPVYEEAIRLDANNGLAYAGLGSAQEQRGDDASAFSNYEKAVALLPNLSQLYTPLGITYYQKGEFAKSEEFLNKAVNAGIDGDQTQYLLGLLKYKNLDYDGAITALKKATTLNNQLAEGYYYLGEIYDIKKMDKDSFEAYLKATQVNPRYAEAWFDLGVAYFNRERYSDAINAYKKAIEFDNSNYEAHENLADIYKLQATETVVKTKQDETAKKDLFGSAEGYYRTAIDLAENHPKNVKAKENKTAMAELYSKYGFVLGRLSKWSSSIAALDKAVTYNPDAFDYTNIGWAYYNFSKTDLSNAAQKTTSETDKARLKAESKQKLEKGRTALQKAVAMDNTSKAAYMNLGVTQNDLGDFAGAVQAMKRCLELQSDWIPALNELGIAYKGLGDLAEAVKNFSKASDLAEKSLSKLKTDLDKYRVTQQLSDGLFNLAVTENERGNTKEAKKAQDKLRKYNPNMANALEGIFLSNVKNRVENKIQEKNPLNKIRIPY